MNGLTRYRQVRFFWQFSFYSSFFIIFEIFGFFQILTSNHYQYICIQFPNIIEDLWITVTKNGKFYFYFEAYEKGHQRPALSVYTFQAPEQGGSSATSQSQPASPISTSVTHSPAKTVQNKQKERPPIPSRCSSLERPIIPVKLVENDPEHAKIDALKGKIKFPIPSHVAKGNLEFIAKFFEFFLEKISH